VLREITCARAVARVKGYFLSEDHYSSNENNIIDTLSKHKSVKA
jgi:hypothetical protein